MGKAMGFRNGLNGRDLALSLAGGAALAATLSLGTAAAQTSPPQVVASIGPVHSLVAGVMGEVGEPQLLIKGAASPHSYSLKPSDAEALRRADLVFWVGEDLETFLEKPLETLAGNAQTVALAEAPGLELLETRSAGLWEGEAAGDHDEDHDDHAAHEDEHHDEDHGEHADEHHEEHADEHHEEHADEHHEEHADEHHEEHADEHHEEHADEHHEEHADEHHEEHADEHHEEHGDESHEAHDDHHGHAHGLYNLHIWLDPRNAVLMVDAIAAALSAADPANAGRYADNAAELQRRLAQLDETLADRLAGVEDAPYIVFHDAYPYLEHRYDLQAVGALSVDAEHAPGAKRLSVLREQIEEAGVRCVFSEPQFEPAVARTIVSGTPARLGELDPLGAALEPGPEAYFQLMEGLADDLVGCLSESS